MKTIDSIGSCNIARLMRKKVGKQSRVHVLVSSWKKWYSDLGEPYKLMLLVGVTLLVIAWIMPAIDWMFTLFR